MKTYCEEKGKIEMENIEKAIRAKHEKEVKTKKGLESASAAVNSYK